MTRRHHSRNEGKSCRKRLVAILDVMMVRCTKIQSDFLLQRLCVFANGLNMGTGFHLAAKICMDRCAHPELPPKFSLPQVT
jgi:hypothetical protein